MGVNTLNEDVKRRLAGRRVLWPADFDGLFFSQGLGKYNRIEVLTWIDKFSEGDFYLGGSTLGFQSEKDAETFKLMYNLVK